MHLINSDERLKLETSVFESFSVYGLLAPLLSGSFDDVSVVVGFSSLVVILVRRKALN